MLNENVTIIILEDELAHIEAIKRILLNQKCKVKVAFSIQEYNDLIKNDIPDLVFTDMNLPDGKAFKILEADTERQKFPIIVMTSFGDETIAVQAIKSGAIDYIVKSENTFNEIPRIAERALREWNNTLKARKVEIEFRESEARFRALVENAPEAIVVLDVEKLKFINFNEKACKLYKLTREELLEKSPLDMSPYTQPDGSLSSEVAISYINKAVDGQNVSFEWVHLDSNNEEIACEIYLTRLPSSKGIIVRGSVLNITERKVVEQELVKAKEKAEESDRLKSSFLANVSHEIRTPMNGILGFAEFLKNPNLTNESKNNYIEIINSCSKQLLSIITDIIEISKIETNQVKITKTKTNINVILKNVYSNLLITIPKTKNISLKLNELLSENDCYINTDETKLQQIISNLIDNAIKFTDNGIVEFGCKNIDNNNIEFYIKDSGIGIAKEYQSIIFDRFRRIEMPQTESRGGTGLGLAICKSYIEILGGKIWLESELGIGTKFLFSIPLEHIEQPKISVPIKQSNIQEAHNFENKQILVAEDDDVNYLYLQEILSQTSATFIRAKNGKQAVELMSTVPNINLVLMDIKMPLMTGLEATIEIRKFNNKVPIIAQTAYAFEEEKQHALKLGCNDYISKPIKRAMLVALIEKYIYK